MTVPLPLNMIPVNVTTFSGMIISCSTRKATEHSDWYASHELEDKFDVSQKLSRTVLIEFSY